MVDAVSLEMDFTLETNRKRDKEKLLESTYNTWVTIIIMIVIITILCLHHGALSPYAPIIKFYGIQLALQLQPPIPIMF